MPGKGSLKLLNSVRSYFLLTSHFSAIGLSIDPIITMEMKAYMSVSIKMTGPMGKSIEHLSAKA